MLEGMDTMAGVFVWICLVVCVNTGLAYDDEDNSVHIGNHSCKHTLQTVDMSKMCGYEINVTTAMLIVHTRHSYFVLDKCLNCTVILRAAPDQQIVLTMYTVGTETTDDGKCGLNRLDVYDGDTDDLNNRLSDGAGICGCKFPSTGDFKSSNHTMTLHFQTQCDTTQHGELDLVVAPIKNDKYNVTECHGEFECQNGECIDKNLVCNGHADCRDHSDEVNCHTHNGTCPGHFECTEGSCIDKNLVCNGHKDCPDGSDEVGCHGHDNSSCHGKFECLNGYCLDKNMVCNGKNDCGDNSDEMGCHLGTSCILLYTLLAVTGLCFILLVVIVIILCCKYCCITFRMASVYRRLS